MKIAESDDGIFSITGSSLSAGSSSEQRPRHDGLPDVVVDWSSDIDTSEPTTGGTGQCPSPYMQLLTDNEHLLCPPSFGGPGTLDGNPFGRKSAGERRATYTAGTGLPVLGDDPDQAALLLLQYGLTNDRRNISLSNNVLLQQSQVWSLY